MHNVIFSAVAIFEICLIPQNSDQRVPGPLWRLRTNVVFLSSKTRICSIPYDTKIKEPRGITNILN